MLNLYQKNSFSLLEVMIALMIISLTVVSLSSVEGVAIKSNRRTAIYTKAVILANSIMSDIVLKSKLYGFRYLDGLDKVREEKLKDDSYKNWKWKLEINDINFPVASLLSKFAEDSKEADNSSNEQVDMGVMNLMMTNLEQLMTSAVRQVVVTVSWPLKAGKEYSSIKLIYYPIDFSVVETYEPSF